MGASFWSDDYYKARETERKEKGVTAFVHTDAIKAGKIASTVHAKLNPLGVKVRESRDSKEHPETLPIGLVIDVTGSMQNVPRTVQQKLPNLLGMLTSKKYVDHPQILFSAIGDSVSDKGSVQIGQFESGIEMDDDLGNMWLEGGGGGSGEESYQNALYFFARHTSTDSFEKRGKKGYLFMVLDERPYPVVSKEEVRALFGDGIEADIPTADIVKECQEKYHVFVFIPRNTSHGGSADLRNRWEGLVGADHVISIQDESAICEAVALAVGLTEGKTTLDKAKTELVGGGASTSAVNSVISSMERLATARGGVGSKAKNVRL